jgi:hypothetical protein
MAGSTRRWERTKPARPCVSPARRRRTGGPDGNARYRVDHPGTPWAEAARVIDANPTPEQRPYRVRYFGETHELVAATVQDAREKFRLSAEHHGGYDRAYNPAEPDGAGGLHVAQTTRADPARGRKRSRQGVQRLPRF